MSVSIEQAARQSQLKLPAAMRELLVCPSCKAALGTENEELQCSNSDCGLLYPSPDGIPVLINERNSVFSFEDFVSHADTFFPSSSKVRKTHVRLLPSIGKNIVAKKNYQRFASLLSNHSPAPKVLVIGGSIVGQGMDSLVSDSSFQLVETDVAFGPRTSIICDAHDIPFADGSFDGVIAQAVLEHVVDPQRCVEEIHRVLNPAGLVYAETPFMQQVHGAEYDFTRFTHLGHRRLFRRFDEVDSGAACGPGMALAWSFQYFLLSFATSKVPRECIKAFSRFATFYLKYFDHYLIDRPGGLDAASGIFFMGRKSDEVLSDHDLLKLYRGAGY